MVYRVVPLLTDFLSKKVTQKTCWLTNKKWGEGFLRIIILSCPLFYIPTLWEVCTAENVEAFKTLTWPLLLLGQASSFVLLSNDGKSDWGVRFCTIIWFIITLFMIIVLYFVR